jgi:excisionase family DNA binding protein
VADPVEKPVRLDERLAPRVAEAARALGIGERTLRQLLPTLPHIRAGGTVLLPVEGLRRWLEEQAKSERRPAEVIADEILAEMRCDSE